MSSIDRRRPLKNSKMWRKSARKKYFILHKIYFMYRLMHKKEEAYEKLPLYAPAGAGIKIHYYLSSSMFFTFSALQVRVFV